MRRRPRLLTGAAIAATAFRGPVASAQAPSAAPPEAPSFVVFVDASSAVAAGLTTALRSHLADARVVVDFRPLPTSAAAAADCLEASRTATAASAGTLAAFCVADLGPALLVYVTEARGDATLIRRIVRGPSGVDAALEEAGIVLRSEVVALRDGAHVGIASAPHPEVLPSTPGATGHLVGVSLGLDYVGTSFTSGAPWQSGAGLAVVGRVGLAQALLRYAIFAPLVIGSATRVVLTRHPLELGIGLRTAGRWGVVARLGAQADAVHRTTAGTDPVHTATADATTWTWSLVGASGVDWATASWIHVDATVGAEVAFRRVSYVVAPGGPISTTAGVRPRAEVGLRFALW